MSQDMQRIDTIPDTGGPNGSPVRQEMPGSTAIFQNTENLGQEHEEMITSQYGSGEIEMMFNNDFFGNLAGAENRGQVENNEMDTAGQQGLAIKPEYHGRDTAPGISEDNHLPFQIDQGNSQLTRLDEGDKNPHGHAAVKREPEVESENHCQDLSFNYPIGEPEHHGEVYSSTLQHTSELPQDVAQDTIINDEGGYQGHGFTDHTGFRGGEYGTEVHTSQTEHEVTIPTNEDFIWPEDPAATDTDFEKEGQNAVFQKNHEDVQSEQQYGGSMSLVTTNQLLGGKGKEIDQPSAFTQAADSWYDHGDMQSRYKGSTMGVTGKETVNQHTQLSSTLLSGPWPAAGTNGIQHQAIGGPIDFTNISASSHLPIQNIAPFATSNTFSELRPPTHQFTQQQSLNPYSQSPADVIFAHQQQLQVQIEEKRRQLENARRLHEQTRCQAQQVNSLSFAQNHASLPASFLMGPLSYQRAPQSVYQQLPSGSNNTGHLPQMHSGSSQSQMAQNEQPGSHPTQSQEVVDKLIGMDRQTPGPSTVPDRSKTQQQDLKEVSNDDEPLITPTKRHPSITSQTSATQQPSTPQPSAPPPAPIDWKLPQYDIQIEPTSADPSQPTAKISIPGLVREEILLSPDHADQEIHLLVNVFLPGQRALTTPDPHPATAVLNFHTIALMVIEAYVQYEIGDELGRRNPFYAPPNEDVGAVGKEQDYERIRDARSAEVDDIFFAVVDRWRAGRESGKQSLQLIRGVQEFCDVALDVIFYVKEHGLLGRQEEEEKEEERGGKAKGKGKGKAVDKEEGVAVLKTKPKGKRAAATEKAETGARKKGKRAVKKEEPKKRGRKPTGITVVKR